MCAVTLQRGVLRYGTVCVCVCVCVFGRSNCFGRVWFWYRVWNKLWEFISRFTVDKNVLCRSQWPRGQSTISAVARLLRSLIRIPPRAWIFVCCECCVLSGRGLCEELITRPEESYRLCCVVVCDLETSRMRRPWPALGRSATIKKCCSSARGRNSTNWFCTSLYQGLSIGARW